MAGEQANWWEGDAAAPTGDAYKATLSPERAAIAQAIVDGRMAIPTGAALRSPAVQQQIQDASMIDPSFDVANAPARVAARKAFTSGKQSQNITSFNTALGHLGTLAKVADELDNSRVPLWNGIANWALTQTGDPRVSNFNTAKQAVVAELERAFKGASGTVHDSKNWEAAINSAQSPDQLRGAIGQAAELLGSRVQALQDSYDDAIGSTTSQPLPLLNPHAREALAAFQNPEFKKQGYKLVSGFFPGGGDATPPQGGDGGAPPATGAPSSPIPPPSPPPSGGGAAMAISDGSVVADDSPEAKALRNQVGAMIANGKSAGEIRQTIMDAGFDPSKFSNIDENVAYAKKHPGYRPDVSLNKQQTGARAVLNGIAASGPGVALGNAANTALFGTVPKLSAGIDTVAGRLSGDNRPASEIYDAALQGNNFKMAASREAHPGYALAGDVGGYFTGEGLLKAGAGALTKAIPAAAALAGRLPGAVKPALTDAAFGAATGAGSSDNLADIPSNVAKGAALSTVGGVLGRGMVKGAAALASPVVGGAVRRLTDADVTLSPGQVLGGIGGYAGKALKGAEDRLAGFPIVGDAINSTRRAGVEDFNRAAINDVLAPVGASLPKDVPVGHQAIAHAQETVSKAIENSLAPIHAPLDQQITSDISAIGQKILSMPEKAKAEFSDIITNDIQPFWPKNGVMTGEQLQAIKRGLDKEIASRTGAGVSPADRRLGDRLADVRSAVLDFAGRADPANAADFAKANEAYSLLSRVESAAAKSTDGVFTPNQFRQAVTKRGYGTTTKNVATGSARMQQLSTDASTVLPSSVPDSGTAGREALMMLGRSAPGAVLGGAAGYHEGGSGGALTGALVGSALLSKPSARAFQWGLAGSRGKTANTLGNLLRRNAAIGGAGGSPLLLSHLANDGN